MVSAMLSLLFSFELDGKATYLELADGKRPKGLTHLLLAHLSRVLDTLRHLDAGKFVSKTNQGCLGGRCEEVGKADGLVGGPKSCRWSSCVGLDRWLVGGG